MQPLHLKDELGNSVPNGDRKVLTGRRCKRAQPPGACESLNLSAVVEQDDADLLRLHRHSAKSGVRRQCATSPR